MSSPDSFHCKESVLLKGLSYYTDDGLCDSLDG